MCFPEIEKTFAVSSLVLNLFASQIWEFFLPHHVLINLTGAVAMVMPNGSCRDTEKVSLNKITLQDTAC